MKQKLKNWMLRIGVANQKFMINMENKRQEQKRILEEIKSKKNKN